MYALALASGSAPGFLDWNNNYGDEADLVVGTHCSNFPRSFMGAEVEISELDLLGETLGKDRCFGAVKGHVAPGPFTFFRMSTDDRQGRIASYLGSGALRPREREDLGPLGDLRPALSPRLAGGGAALYVDGVLSMDIQSIARGCLEIAEIPT